LCSRATKDDRNTANASFNIGNIYLAKGDMDAALKNYQVSLDLYNNTGDNASVASVYSNMGYVYMKQKKYDEAYKKLGQAESLSKQIGQKDFLSNTYSALAELDSVTGDYKASLQHYKLFRLYTDSLNNEENTRKTVEAQLSYEFNKQTAIQQVTQEKKDLIIKKDKQRQKVINLCVGGGSLLLILFCFSLMRNVRQKQRSAKLLEEKNTIIEEKQREILDSIHYARRIQRSQMATEKYIEKTLRRLQGKT
jgi:tetratricopeptide (TPR) repeat protein